AAARRYSLFDVRRPPGARFVFSDRSVRLQRRIDDAPRLFHVILAGKQCSVSRHGVSQQLFVSIHIIGPRMATRHYFDRLAGGLLPPSYHSHAESDGGFGAHAKPHVVLRQTRGGIDGWRLAESREYLCAGNGQALSSSNVEGHSLPAPRINGQPQRGERL